GNTRSYLHADVHAATWSSGALFVADDGGIGIFRDPYREPPPQDAGIVQSDFTFLDNRHDKGLATDLLYAIGSAAPAAAPAQKDLVSAGAQDNGLLARRPVSAGDWTGSLLYDEVLSGDGTAAIIHPVTPGVLL